MRTSLKTAAAVLAAVVLLFLWVERASRTSPSEPPPGGAIESTTDSGDLAEAGDEIAEVGSAATGGERSRVSVLPPLLDSTVATRRVLRVILDGISEEEATLATVTVTGLLPARGDDGPEEVEGTWPCQGLASEFDLDPFFARSVDLPADLQLDELEVVVDHPFHFLETTRIPIASGVEMATGIIVFELRVRLMRPEFWPEFTLTVRDAHTLAHLDEVELRIRPGPGMARWGQNGTTLLLGDGLSSPIALMGGRQGGEATVAGVALASTTSESPQLVELPRRWPPDRGVLVSARAPGYAWGSISIDVSQGDRELLLEPSAAIDVRLTNVQLESYRALQTTPMLSVYRIRDDGGLQYVHFEPIDEILETEGLQLENLAPGGYRVAVELGGGSWTEPPVLAEEELSGESALTAGERRALRLALVDAPRPPARAALGGVISLPRFGGEEEVRLQIYFQPTQRWRKPDIERFLADLQPLSGALPTWSFREEGLPVGMYRVQLLPFLKAWMVDLTAEGVENLELVLPELAEVHVETVDGHSGERVPREELWYRNQEQLPDQQQNDLARAVTDAPGLFHFWTVPGEVRVWPKFPNGSEREFGGPGKDLVLVSGQQSMKFALAPVYALLFEFREDGTALPTGPLGLQTRRDIRAVDHDGRVTGGGLQRDMRVEVSGPGLYEIHFDGLDAERYFPVPPRRVEVRAGEPTLTRTVP